MNVTLLATLIITQVALWVGYKHQMAGKTLSMFWGNVPRSMWTYLLGAATVAYAMNLFFLGKLALGNPRFPNTLAMATVAYYGMQMLFLPMVEQAVEQGFYGPSESSLPLYLPHRCYGCLRNPRGRIRKCPDRYLPAPPRRHQRLPPLRIPVLRVLAVEVFLETPA